MVVLGMLSMVTVGSVTVCDPDCSGDRITVPNHHDQDSSEEHVDPNLMKLILLNPEDGPGAVCLDGSPGGFYFRPSLNPANANDWVLHFKVRLRIFWQDVVRQAEASACYRRVPGGATTRSIALVARPYKQGGSLVRRRPGPTRQMAGALGFSLQTARTTQIFATSTKLFCALCVCSDPRFQRSNVFTRLCADRLYCDGASFTGDRTDPVIVNGKQLHFRGRRIMDAILKRVLTDESIGVANAKNVLLTGCSSGALAAYLHANHVEKTITALAPNLKRFRVAADSGCVTLYIFTRGCQ